MEQTAITTRDRGWNVSMAMPLLEQAQQYQSDLKVLGYESKAPEETAQGFVVKWRRADKRKEEP